MVKTNLNKGYVTQIIGPVLDIAFPDGNLPPIYSAVEIKLCGDLGNTIVVVEHDEDTIRSSDHIVDLGPGAGIFGGHVVAEGNLK